jgi:hypothetical protein
LKFIDEYNAMREEILETDMKSVFNAKSLTMFYRFVRANIEKKDLSAGDREMLEFADDYIKR